MTNQQADSLAFRFSHHYTVNYNFVVTADSLALLPHEGDIIDTCWVYRGDPIVVAEIRQGAGSREQVAGSREQGDTTWVKVFRDQVSMGWVDTETLRTSTVPDDNISKAINYLSGIRATWMPVLLLLGVVGFFLARHSRKKIHVMRRSNPAVVKVYSAALLVLVAAMSALYGGVQVWAPEFWQEYYYHPTLNPFILPTVMAALLTSVWAICIVSIALVIAAMENFRFTEALNYLLEMVGLSMGVYLLVSCGFA